MAEFVATLRSATDHWHQRSEPAPGTPDAASLLLQLHRANFDLWHEEDKARDPSATDAEIATVKRTIDRLNQQRNDTVERLDNVLLQHAGEQNQHAPLNSESPGLIFDRLSILQLKIFHTAEQAERDDVNDAHRQRNLERLHILEMQSADLAQSLQELWRDVLAGSRRFKLYRQMKMYNDPALNPAIYGSSAPPSAR